MPKHRHNIADDDDYEDLGDDHGSDGDAPDARVKAKRAGGGTGGGGKGKGGAGGAAGGGGVKQKMFGGAGSGAAKPEPPGKSKDAVFYKDFTAIGGGKKKYDQSNLIAEVKQEGCAVQWEGAARIINATVGDGEGLDMTFPEKCVGAKDNGGCVCVITMPKKMHEATITYQVLFEEGFTWTAGGKLPGLGSAECPAGFKETCGHFSSRVMWRAGGKLVSYVYCDDKEKGCGDDWPWRFTAPQGKWTTVSVYIKLNDVGKQNGSTKAWANGNLVFEDDEVEWRGCEDAVIENIALHFYHGGGAGDPRFEPDHEQHIKLAWLEVKEGMHPPA